MEEVHSSQSSQVEDEVLKPVLTSLDFQRQGDWGSTCPKCHQGVLDYDGMLNLTCPVCGYQEGGCFT
ncbi:hypothetical protein ANT_12040 [Anaerolinea thermophila UNI-1]|uniref:Uncharacterized protein n=1 Tax=Anaerolinea thermophila (strain DSM 14523 / JCM 11388 / NBRC 100420 / UNI-1) TaxID=926569 RepID=E8N474_ANATU|nr:hypothetical protein ANT_12040 [Anaerolinea thermophila UNI-1]